MKKQKQSDKELVQSVINGNIDSFEIIVSKYKNTIFAMVLNTIYDYHSAEDITQETFIDCYFSLSKLKDKDRLFSYIYGIAKRKALNFALRKKSCADIEDFSETLCDNSPYPEEIVIRDETVSEIRLALSHLSDKNRVVAEMFYLEDMSVNSIALVLDLAVGTVKSRLHEARNKLKGELKHMNIDKKTLPCDFEQKVKEAIQKIRYYQVLNGSYEGYDDFVDETMKMAESFPDSEKNKILSEALLYKTWHYDTDENLRKEAYEAAEKAGNDKAICSLLVHKLFEIDYNDVEKQLNFIDKVAMPKMEAMNSGYGRGTLYMWRGRIWFRQGKLDLAREDFEKAVALVDKENNYHACAVSAIKCVDYAKQYCENITYGISVTGETHLKVGEKHLFAGQPGFGVNANSLYTMHRHDAFNYYISICNKTFFDTSMKIGEKRLSSDGLNTLELISMNELVKVKAGTFQNCMHVRTTVTGEYAADAFYAQNVGLVKVVFTNCPEESYELCDYTIKGGTGYYPMYEGNRWEYDNPNLPDYIFRKFENEVDWTDGTRANYSVVAIVTHKKNYLSECELDGQAYIFEADKCCDKWDVDGAIQNLQKAVRVNSTLESTLTALGGIEYLKAFKAAYDKKHFVCPSSYNTSYFVMDKNQKQCCYDEAVSSFGPYKYGTRHEENRIFGVKAFRYLQEIGCVFDYENWKDGYTKEYTEDDYYEFKTMVSVNSVSQVTIGLGTFYDCLKVTISRELVKGVGEYYFSDGYRYVDCGLKEIYFAKGVGIVKADFTWGKSLFSNCELTYCDLPAADKDSYFPVQIGNKWEYTELNLKAENYTAKRIVNIVSGFDNKYVLNDCQQFWYNGTQEEYDEFKERLKNK